MVTYLADGNARIVIPHVWFGGFKEPNNGPYTTVIRTSTEYGLATYYDETGGRSSFSGVDLKYDSKGRIVGGYFTEYHSYDLELLDWNIYNTEDMTGFRVSAKAVFDAGVSKETMDDALLFSVIFSGNDTFGGGQKRDVVRAYGGDDVLSGNGGNDSLLGWAGRDELFGGDGNDFLHGGLGDDKLYGGAGLDRLYGGGGRDILSGGSGKDTFIFDRVSNSTVPAFDAIIQFNRADDIIDLAKIDADAELSGDQAFTFIGTSAFSDTPGELRSFISKKGGTYIQGDVDGDGVVDLQIKLSNNLELTALDFLA